MQLDELSSGVFVGGPDGAFVRRSVLPSGARILTERIPGTRSASVGFWLPVGSCNEQLGRYGVTHFLEHLLFKGTVRRSAMDIAVAFDEVGGESNAATSKEYTCYYARVLDSDLPMAVNVLADMVTAPTLLNADIDSERGVILEELAMSEDDLTDVVHERFAEVVFAPHPLARPIAGTPESIRDLPNEAVREQYRDFYHAGNLVVTAAGSVDHDQLVALVQETLDAAGWETPGKVPTPVAWQAPDQNPTGAVSHVTVHRPSEQAHVCFGGLGLPDGHPDRFALAVLHTALGSGMSSRLYQQIREERGLAYSVYSFSSAYADAGLFGLYAACAPSSVQEVVSIMDAEWKSVAENGITESEMRRARGQLAGSLALGSEDTGSRMSRLYRAEMVFKEFVDLEEVLQCYRDVTIADVQRVAAWLYSQPRHACVVGPYEDSVTFEL